ncbi:MAG: hypothetical protein GY792_23350 [Gammaproteobacteria bacterium]|nr:hypothetical protein [Gammaproteobacteria bacterium]
MKFSFGIFPTLLAALSTLAAEPAAVAMKDILTSPERPIAMRYHEEKRLQILSQALTSSGLLRFIPPDTLVREEDGWRDIIYRIEGDQISISEDKKVLRQLDLKLSPEIAGIATTLRALLAADTTTLEKHYTLALTGSSSDWTLQLTPRIEPISRFVEKILIDGGNGQIRRIDTYEQSGDKSRLTLVPDG